MLARVRFVRRSFLLLALLGTDVPEIAGQTSNATLHGTIADTSSAVLPGVIVKLESPATGLTREAVTNSAGVYVFNFLPAGNYQITAELAGFNLNLRDGRRETLAHVVGDLFPQGGNAAEAAFWCGLRPMTPDGPPIIGGTRYQNLYLNTGHGTLGCTMACGSGRIMADLLSGSRPEVDIGASVLER